MQLKRFVTAAIGAPLLVVLTACATHGAEEEERAQTKQRFSSADAVLVDLELDTTLTASTLDLPTVRELIARQLMFLVGQLNGDRSVGRHERAQFSVTTFGGAPRSPGSYAFTYHAKIPVAWGGGEPPASYEVKLPARVGEADQVAFADRYASTCTDPEGGVAGGGDAGRMFLFYRPQRAGCVLAPEDVATTTARLTKSVENTVGKYPDYHRVWEDEELDVVALFGMDHGDARRNDAGTQAYEAFVKSAEDYVRSVQADPQVSPVREKDQGAMRSVRLAGQLPGRRTIRIDVALLAPHLSPERSPFDDWYDARTFDADLVIYSGHAGLGSNARTLATKGAFRARKYVVMTINGCDTLAYLDRTLADRRAVLNPDDPSGTKYMDTISNVLGGYFRSGDDTALHLVRAFVSAQSGAPKTYEQIFEGMDATQIAVVTGEEDNEFEPGMLKPAEVTSDGGVPPPATAERVAARAPEGQTTLAKTPSACSASGPSSGGALGPQLFAAAGIVLGARRFRRRAAARRTRSGSPTTHA
jgi:hypothetical protein